MILVKSAGREEDEPMGWNIKEYFREFGHDIEMAERQQKRALEDELEKFYRTGKPPSG